MPGYVYKGTQHEPTPKPGKKPGKFNPQLCGGNEGVWRHRYLKELNCDKCREFTNEQRRNSYHETKNQPPKAKRLATIEKLQKAEKLFASGASQWEVQRKLSMSRMTLRKYFPGQGWINDKE